MAAPVIGLFGSNVGKGIKLRDPYKPVPVGVMHLTAPSVKAAPVIHASPRSPGSLLSSSGSSSSAATAIPTNLGPASGGGGGNVAGDLLGSLAGGIEGFIGHLGTDIVHTAMGLPVGVAYMLQHPIAGLEGAGKLTWADWSPLFHAAAALESGDFSGAYADTSLWAHNFYEHPLAPILDVAGFLTFGAGTAARGAAVAGKLGEAAAGADAAGVAAAAAKDVVVQSGYRSSLAAGGAHTAQSAGEIAGTVSAGMAAPEWWMKAARFASPAKYAAATYGKMAYALGYTGDAADEFMMGAMANDPLARRIFETASGVKMTKDVADNPWTRIRQRMIANHITNPIAESAIGQAVKADKFMGDQSTYGKLLNADAGVRRAAFRAIVPNEIKAVLGELDKMGQAMKNLDPVTRLQHLVPGIRTGLIGQAHEVAPAGLIGSAEHTAQLEQLAKENLQFVTSDSHAAAEMDKAYRRVDVKGEAGFNDFLKEDFPKANTLPPSKFGDGSNILKDANGNYRVVSSPDQMAKEALFSHAVLRTLITDPVRVWKYLILGTSPRYFVNNFVGNTLMLMVATNPVAMVKGFHGYMTAVRGEAADWAKTVADMHAAGRSAEDIALAQATRELTGKNWMHKWFSGEYGFGQYNMMHEEYKAVKNPLTGKEEMVKQRPGRLDRLNSNPKLSLHHITNKYADMPQRYAALNYSMKRMPEFQQVYARLRAGGMRHFEAEQKAAMKAAESPAVRQLVREQVHHMLGQYHTFSRGERALTAVVPFYAWDRAIALHMKNLIVQQPYKVAMGAAIGTLGGIKTQEMIGQVPDFMLSGIPAKLMSGPLAALMGKNGNRISVVNAASLNPYGTIADLTGMGLAATGSGHFKAGDSLGATLNPVIQSGAAQLAGVSLQTGLPQKPAPGGPLLGTYLGVFGNVPQLNLAKALVGMEGGSLTSKGKPTLYAHNLQASLSSYLGMPIRQVDAGTAKGLYDKQEGIKHPRQKKNMYSVPGL